MGSAPVNVFRWVAGIVAALNKAATERSWRLGHPQSDITVQSRNGRATAPAGEDVTTESRVAKLAGDALQTERVAVDAKIDRDVQVDRVAAPPDDQEVQRRRDLVRTMFNDFWSGFENKPTSFADRLDQAESYLNERLTACGEFSRLDAKTRELLWLAALVEFT